MNQRRKLFFADLQDVMRDYVGEIGVTLARNFCLGGAAACLAALLGILQIGANDRALTVATYAAVIGMPLWLCGAGCYELILMLSPHSHGWIRTRFGANAGALPSLFGALCLITCLVAIIYHMSPSALYGFAWSSGLALVYYLVVHYSFAHWWFKNDPRRNAAADSARDDVATASLKPPGEPPK